jgi:adenylate kinase family enzyme
VFPAIALSTIHNISFTISIGRTMRSLAESEPKPLTENFAIKEAITAGEMVAKDSLDKILHNNLLQLVNKKGIIIDGYPRDMNQIHDFVEKVRSVEIGALKCSINNRKCFHFTVQSKSTHCTTRLFEASTRPRSFG